MFGGVTAVVARVLIRAWAADQFVTGATRVALVWNVPPLVVSVIVAGSNLANLTVLLGPEP